MKNSDLDDFSFNTGTKLGQTHSSLYDTLMELCKEKKMLFSKPTPYVDFRPPKLCKGKEWYIHYSVKDPQTSKMKRFRVKINHIPNKERIKAANTLMADLQQKLLLGWNPIVDKIAPKAQHPIGKVLSSFVEIKAKELEDNSMRSYRSYIKILSLWLQARGISMDTPIYLIDSTTATAFMDEIEGQVSARTYNNYIRFYKTFWNWLIERGYCKDNPFQKIIRKPKRLLMKNRRVLSADERRDLEQLLKDENPEFFTMCLLCYYCFIRPKEIALLKVGDIRVKEQVVIIRGAIAKNDKDSCRTIPDAMMQYILKLNLSAPADYYLFGQHPEYDFTPGTQQICSRKIAKYWDEYVRRKLHWGKELQFYSLKDTGVTNMISDGIPLTFVQEQADHSSIAMTAVYVHKGGIKARDEIKKVHNF